MSRLINITGERFGSVIAIRFLGRIRKSADSYWEFKCDCGNIIERRGIDVRRGMIGHCGCLRGPNNTTRMDIYDSAEKFSVYNSWVKMRDRCFNQKAEAYKNYGGRGITVCPRWKDDFVLFAKDMGPKPQKDYSLDRINNDGNYEPGNCRWADRITQNNNTRLTQRAAVPMHNLQTT